MRIAYVGVGNMGGAIASALAARHDVQVFDPSADAVEACVANGATASASVREAVTGARAVFLCLPSVKIVEEMLADDGALLAAAAPGTVVIDQSTSDPRRTANAARRLSVSRLELVDAPVSGGPAGVAQGSIAIMIGGSAANFSLLSTLFTPITRHLFHTGPAGTGMMTKLANNYIAAAQAIVSLQALALAVKFGCDAGTTVDAVNASSGSNAYVRRFLKDDVLSGKLAIGATVEILQKDVELARDVAGELGAPLLGDASLSDLIAQCVARYGASASYNAIAYTAGEAAGVSLVGSMAAAD